MDREELKNELAGFIAHCEKKGKPITDICVEEAYPGDSSTSYFVKVKADWIDGVITCSSVLDFLFDSLWETTTVAVREKIFAIKVIDSNNQLHCEAESELAI